MLGNAPLPLTVTDVTSARFWTGVAGVPATDVARAPATAAMATLFIMMVFV